jgi:hypothetical protein
MTEMAEWDGLSIKDKIDDLRREWASPNRVWESDLGPAFRESGSRPDLVARTVTTLLDAVATTLGECRRDTPYAPLQPVISAAGTLEWCCTHHPEHCVRS